MAAVSPTRPNAPGTSTTRPIEFETHPSRYRHWRLEVAPPVARLVLDVDEAGGLFDGYALKQNSYDLGVDIELADAVQRLRFEHPEVRAVTITSAKLAFCAGANIRMLAGASHAHKVNFCKFTNETRNAIEDATRHSGQRYVAALNGTAAGGGYELALATDHILLVDDGNAAVSLPEVPLLAVLPGTGGLTRLTDKRRVRRDIADLFCTLEEGMRGERALGARLVDELAPRGAFEARAREIALRFAGDAAVGAPGIALTPLEKTRHPDGLRYRYVDVEARRTEGWARLVLRGPESEAPADAAGARAQGAAFWPLALLRELDDALLELRFNEPALGTIVIASEGALDRVLAHDALVAAHAHDPFLREVALYARRVWTRLDLTARSLFAVIETGSCFGGFLAEAIFAADRSYMLDGTLEGRGADAPAAIALTAANFAGLEMVNGLSRIETRFLGEPASLAHARTLVGRPLHARAAIAAGLVTSAPDDIDWEVELRLALEARTHFSPDALTGLEANLRFAGPETLESKIFARLTAWQNWIFQRPNAVGENGALSLYGTGRRPAYDRNRT
jgi:benzoyl-CoA-dihydrodiol lyase